MRKSRKVLAVVLTAVQVFTCLNFQAVPAAAWGSAETDPEYDKDGVGYFRQTYDLTNHPDQIPFTVVYQYGNDTTDAAPNAKWHEVLWLDSTGVVGDEKMVDAVYKASTSGSYHWLNDCFVESKNYDGTLGGVEREITFTAPEGYYFFQTSYRYGNGSTPTGVQYKLTGGTKVRLYTGEEMENWYTSMTYRFKAGSIFQSKGTVNNRLAGMLFKYFKIPKVDSYIVYNGDFENKVFSGKYYVPPAEIGSSPSVYVRDHYTDFIMEDSVKEGYHYIKTDLYSDEYDEKTKKVLDSYAANLPYGSDNTYDVHLYHYYFDFDKYELEHHVRYQVVDVDGNPVPGTTLFGKKTNAKGFISLGDVFTYSRDVKTYSRTGVTGYYPLNDIDYGAEYHVNQGEETAWDVRHNLTDEEKALYPEMEKGSYSESVYAKYNVIRTNKDTIAPYAEYKGSISIPSNVTGYRIQEVDDTHSIVQVISSLKGVPAADEDVVNEVSETRENEDGSTETVTEREYQDGSTETETEREYQDGSTETESERKYPDGSRKLSSEKENADGTVQGSEVSIGADGKVSDIKTHEKTKTGETTIPYQPGKGKEVTAEKITTTEKNFSIPDKIEPADGKTYQVTAVADDAMKSNRMVEKLTMGGNIRNIGKRAFQKCSCLQNVKFSNKVQNISDGAFSDCKKLKEVSLPSSARSIGKACFKNCKSMTKFVFGSAKKGGLKNTDGTSAWGALVKISIGANALENCARLKVIIINSQVTEIGNSAFKQCKKLAKVIVYSLKLKIIGKTALKGVHDCSIKVPKKRLKSYKILFKNKGQGKKVVVAKL